MFVLALLFGILLERSQVYGIELNSVIPRLNCYPDEQPNCNEELIVAYPNVSKSVTGLTNATTWFFLFTRKNPDVPELLHKCAGKLPPNSNFNASNPVNVILTPFIAGFCDIAAYREWKEQFLIRDDVNVLVVDYTWGNRPDYALALENIKIVAQQTVIVLNNIKEETGLQGSQIYMIGHSLGAHLGGLIGNMTEIGRITGVDPAGPGYAEDTPLKDRLDSSDAALVDVWHTNAGKCLPFLGINYNAGHLDFWINGGTNQHQSCDIYALISFIKRDVLYAIGTALIDTTCSHTHVTQYYKVSINPGDCQFVGVKCDSYLKFKAGLCSCGAQGENCMIMGYDTDKYINNSTSFPQQYFVDTSLFCPYCDNRFLRLEGFQGTYDSSLQK